ncbi:peptidase C25-like protein [Algoriphagus boseongensis]|uniref:Peptidase C25-like protein n=1 Tax=Algoriphagus boseongensis TaxID=1442587 RepID=A0A4R6T692_9BACT|nr:C25 family cysteine peptidase [Algoriphagus boseongensis]TDQ15227.1 peptidase C25-like protein [Algoriphagus boseongensis]
MKSRWITLLLFFFLIFNQGFAQAPEPVWYDYSSTYYKIPTAQDGIYQINSQALTSSGINLSTLDPRFIRIFHRGKEVAVHIEGQDDGKFDAGDLIHFLGKRNDAELDKKLYTKFEKIPNPYYNTYTDTTAFFLTVTPGVAGKRMSVRPVANVGLPQINGFETEQLQVFSENYSLGRAYAFGFRLSSYDLGQGWMSGIISKGASRDFTFSNLGSIPNSGTATLEIGLVGRSESSHSTVISVGPNASSQRVLTTTNYSGFEYPQLSLNLSMSDFNTNGTLVVRVNSNGPEATDNTSVAYAKITFRRNVSSGDFSSQVMIFPTGNQQVVLNQVQEEYVAVEESDLFNAEWIPVTKQGTVARFVATVTSKPSKIRIQQRKNLIQVGQMKPVKFRNYLAQPANFILVGHSELEKPSKQFQNPLKAYAAHRASAEGGRFDTLTIRMEEIYDQFAYGEKSSVALYEFLRAYYPVHKPTHLLLAARSLAIFAQGRINNQTVFYRNGPSAFSFQDLVPVAGFPYSDNAYVVGLDPQNPELPAMAVGRIPAKNSQQLSDYLGKAIEKDLLGATEPWQKEILHLSGGLSEFELERYFAFLNSFKTIAEGPYLGGSVKTYRKRSNSVVEVIDITGDLNSGKSLLTFFGHGAPTVIDIEIGFASDPTLGYANKGKYPVMLFNGCDYGEAYSTFYTQGEDWVITPDKGASHVMANTALGIDVYLRFYSDQFYKKSFADSSLIYKTVGEIKQLAEQDFLRIYGQNPLIYSHMEQMVMLGDPGARMFPANKPDYSLKAGEVSLGTFDDSPLSAISDSLKLSFALRNIGITNSDSIEYRVSRKLPNGTEIQFDPVKIASVSRLDTLTFSVPNLDLEAAGDNVFTISVNANRVVDEMTFLNNTISYTAFIPLSGTVNIYPVDFGIVNEKEIKLITQAPGKLKENRTLIIQLDTTARFNSSFRKEIRLTTSGLAEWPVSLSAGNDSTTYFWRSKFQEPLPGESEAWTVSSFSFIPNGPNGWTQRVGDQLRLNQLDNLSIKENTKTWEYLKQQSVIEVFTVGAGVDSLTFRNTQFYLNQIPQIIDNANNANSRLCPNGSLGMVSFDFKSLLPYLAIPIPGFDILDARACGRVPQMIQSIQNSWITTPGNTFLQDYVRAVRDGDYVVIFSVGNVNFDAWPERAYESLKQFGASEATLRALSNGDPYILFGRKGMRPGEAIEIVGNPNFEVPARQQTLRFDTQVEGYITKGVILTPRIGPASTWERFFQNINTRNWIQEEETYFDILGVRENGQEDLILSEVRDQEIDLSFVNPTNYPYLRLKYSMDDSTSTAPAQLDKWQVNFEGVPEGVLVQKTPGEPIRLREGQNAQIGFVFRNASRYNFLDSIQVDWKITNLTSKKVENFSKKFPSLPAGESLEFVVDFSSVGKAGENELEVFANPRIQREQNFRNNVIKLGTAFVVEGDNSTSLLDVNFDGVYIMDGDLVSPNVMITALLKNDQTLLYKKDTVGMEIFLKKNCEACQFQRINFSNPSVTWSPASENEDFRVSFIPGPLEDGIYTLRITNENSNQPYEITFEVVNESQISNFYPYPNPFSTSVRFVFTLTGSEIPDEIKIQIITVTGRVVREILQDELGPIRIGNNITEYAWDGRDEFGDQLANGVYIYRVLIRKNGQFMEHRPTAGDRGFTKGYGKMYLLR